MVIKFTNEFKKQFKKADAKIKKRFAERLELFKKNTNDPQLRNHALRGKYQRFRSIDVTGDWRAIYREEKLIADTIFWFSALGSHSQLYR
jgi:addiction module RelE/StbE family toxin